MTPGFIPAALNKSSAVFLDLMVLKKWKLDIVHYLFLIQSLATANRSFCGWHWFPYIRVVCPNFVIHKKKLQVIDA